MSTPKAHMPRTQNMLVQAITQITLLSANSHYRDKAAMSQRVRVRVTLGLRLGLAGLTIDSDALVLPHKLRETYLHDAVRVGVHVRVLWKCHTSNNHGPSYGHGWGYRSYCKYIGTGVATVTVSCCHHYICTFSYSHGPVMDLG